jgi:hypothetical protein
VSLLNANIAVEALLGWQLNCHPTAAIRWTLRGSRYIMGEIERRGLAEATPDMLPARGNWQRFWELGVERLVLWVAILAVLLAVAYYVGEKIRPKPAKKEHKASQWLSNFRELHSQGELSDEEFRTIKTNLAAQLQDELSDNGKEG